MIKLHRTNKKIHRNDLIEFVSRTLISYLDPIQDLILVSNFDFINSCLSYLSINEWDNRFSYFQQWILNESIIPLCEYDLENIIFHKLRNIILIDFDLMDSSSLRCIVNNSKTTEIIGVSLGDDRYAEQIRNDISTYQKLNYSKDQILIMMNLKHHIPVHITKECLNTIKFRNLNVEYIDDLNVLCNLVKG